MTKAFSGNRRFLALWFPYLSADRWRRENAGRGEGGKGPGPHPPGVADAPFAFIEKQRGAMRIVAVDPAARALGIAPGQMLADARAAEPGLEAIDHDPVADARLLERLADACDRYTPMVEIDGNDGLTLDTTGAAHHHGGEAGLAAHAEQWCAGLGIHMRHAFAATPEAAQALARYQTVPGADEEAAVRRLPVAALRLEDDEVELALRRAGLKTIGDLASWPGAPLAARFGEGMTAALGRLLGLSDSRISPRRALPALVFERRFAEPIARTEDALATIADLAKEAAAVLLERHMGGRRFAARLYRADGLTRDLAVEASLPLREVKAIRRLFDERLQSLADPLDPGFGYDLIRLAVPVLEPLAPAQLRLEGGTVAEAALAALVDRLSTRAGRARFRRLAPRDTHIPEQAVLALPAVEAARPAPWAEPEAGEPPLRPLHLFEPPQPIDVIAEVPDGPPHRFRWRRVLHEVTRFEGPERIAAEWWKRADNAGLTRDYYRVEDARGRRFWIFRHGLYGTERDNPAWYVHGLFA